MPRPVVEKDRGPATKHILSLNAFINEAAAILKRDLQKLWPEHIIWERQTQNFNGFTWYEKCHKTPMGRPPKYGQCLHYWVVLLPIEWNELSGHHKNVVFGDIFLQKGSIGKAQIIHWTGHDCVIISVKLAGENLKVWKIEINNTTVYKNA